MPEIVAYEPANSLPRSQVFILAPLHLRELTPVPFNLGTSSAIIFRALSLPVRLRLTLTRRAILERCSFRSCAARR